jgi:hypothetical protein
VLFSKTAGGRVAAEPKDDDRDAQLLADILRTDRGRFIPWQADGPLERPMRTLISSVDDLTGQIVAPHNRLRAVLLRYFPQPLTAFESLISSIALPFLAEFPAHSDLERLTFDQFEDFCHRRRYFCYRYMPKIFAHLQQPAPGLDPMVVPDYRFQTAFLANQLLLLTQQKTATIKQVNELFQRHPRRLQ